MKVSELVKILKRNGCKFVRHGKEHDVWQSSITNKKIRIPRHKNQEIPTGTAKQILKDAGLN